MISYFINPHNTNIFYWLIIPCGVQLDPRPRFTIYTYRNETGCLYFLTLDISYERESEKCHSTTPQPQPKTSTLSNISVIYKQKLNWLSEPNEQDIRYPITSLIFVIESQSLCPYPCFQGQGSQFLHLFCNGRNFF